MAKFRYLVMAFVLAIILVCAASVRSVLAATNALITLSGVKYNDINDNGTRDPGEPGLSGWTIYLDLNNNGQFDLNEPSAVTDANGDYTITTEIILGEIPAQFTLHEVGQPNWVQTQSPAPFPLPPPTYTDLDFGNHLIPPPAEVPESDTLWLFGAGGIAMVLYIAYRRRAQSAPVA